jgi:hypothetical protein
MAGKNYTWRGRPLHQGRDGPGREAARRLLTEQEVLPRPRQDLEWPYRVEMSARVRLQLAMLPDSTCQRIRERLQEIAGIAGLLASRVSDSIESTLQIEVDGYVVSYVVSDAQRLLSVLSLVQT